MAVFGTVEMARGLARGSPEGNESAHNRAGTSVDAEAILLPRISLEDLPPLPERGEGYNTEPFGGICLVGTLCVLLVGMVQASAAAAGADRGPGGLPMTKILWAEAIAAVFCVAYLLFGNAGVIQRSEASCYPIPAEVEECLLSDKNAARLGNVSGPMGSPTLGTYCVRCFVWRPPKEKDQSHHCRICQRCVVGFDHHCDVFGRCIVRANMPCFMTLVGLMCVGMVSAMVGVCSNMGG